MMRLLIALFPSALLSACIVLPVPVPTSSGAHGGSRASLGTAAPSDIVAGETTRTEVLLKLGEPDVRGLDDRWFSYNSLVGRGGVRWTLVYAVGAGGGGTGGANSLGNWDTSSRLTVKFDDRGFVSAVSFDRKDCTAWDANNCLAGADQTLVAEDDSKKGEALTGALVASYHGYLIVASRSTRCRYSDFGTREHGDPFEIRERGLAWIDFPSHRREILRFQEIQDVRPVERHLGHWWIPIQKLNGSCLFLQVASDEATQHAAQYKIATAKQNASGS
jgi:outer membrane protein assembly factor BamE (lipoprotein component of BamABCDE complex)